MTTIQTLDQALAHLGANDPLRPDACKTLLDYMSSGKIRARFASWSRGGVDHDEVVSTLLEAWLRRGRAIDVKKSAEGVVLRSLRNAFGAVKRERSKYQRHTISLDDEENAAVQVTSPAMLEHPGSIDVLEAMPILGEMLLSRDVDEQLQLFFVERIAPLCSKRTRETTRQFIEDRVALTCGRLTLTEACANFSGVAIEHHSADSLAKARNTYHQNAVRSRARIEAVLSSKKSLQALELTGEEVLAIRRWALEMGLISN